MYGRWGGRYGYGCVDECEDECLDGRWGHGYWHHGCCNAGNYYDTVLGGHGGWW